MEEGGEGRGGLQERRRWRRRRLERRVVRGDGGGVGGDGRRGYLEETAAVEETAEEGCLYMWRVSSAET